MKTCRLCGETKPCDDFQDRKDSPDGKRNECRACKTTAERRNYQANREKHLAYRRTPKVRYANFLSKRKMITGFTPELYDETLARQGGVCAICGCDLSKLPVKHVHADHCHKTATPRGVLCHWCNSGLGMFKDNPELLSRAKEYLDCPPVAQALV